MDGSVVPEASPMESGFWVESQPLKTSWSCEIMNGSSSPLFVCLLFVFAVHLQTPTNRTS